MGGAILRADTLGARERAVAVLSLLIVQIAARQHWLVRLWALACAALTRASFAIMHRFALMGTPLLRTVVSLAATGELDVFLTTARRAPAAVLSST